MKALPGPFTTQLSGSLGGITIRSGRNAMVLSSRRNKPVRTIPDKWAGSHLMSIFAAYWNDANDEMHDAWRLYASFTSKSPGTARSNYAAGREFAFKAFCEASHAVNQIPQDINWLYPYPDNSSAPPLVYVIPHFYYDEEEYNLNIGYVPGGLWYFNVFLSRMFRGDAPTSARSWRYIYGLNNVGAMPKNIYTQTTAAPISWKFAVGETVAIRINVIQETLISGSKIGVRFGPPFYAKTTVEQHA